MKLKIYLTLKKTEYNRFFLKLVNINIYIYIRLNKSLSSTIKTKRFKLGYTNIY